ncbi:MAG: S-methyl-5-thioribose-1-phosphate isomerase [Thermodesulfobacteria bacterium]|nr:S-methyl-5-thioribose-1-phosphate isomerase [Thermodesulfobacteriota bacterium]
MKKGGTGTLSKEKFFEPEGADKIKPFLWTEKGLYVLDQRKLPLEEKYILCDSIHKIRKAIKVLAVRGAPAIGICAGIGFVIGLENWLKKKELNKFKVNKLRQVVGWITNLLATARPTAVNLFWALERQNKVFESFVKDKEVLSKSEVEELLEILKKEALKIWEEDIKANLKMGEFGEKLLPEGGILTHCNTGALATGGYGTALGVIRSAWNKGKKILVYVDETRPLLQGARLTAWELSKLKISYKVITDNSAGFLMQLGKVKAVILGADRIAKNGDTANKIGTYALAVLAKYHGIPFYVAAPSSTFDLKAESKKDIPIEERSSCEVLNCFKSRITPPGAEALNFAFDITPGELITAFITEKGIIKPPFEQNIPKVVSHES